MTDEFVIRDLLYFDVEKAASIYSQMIGGLPERTEHARESEEDERNIRRYRLPMFSPEFGGSTTTRTAEIEVRVVHHDLLNRVEKLLFDQGMALDLNEKIGDADQPPDSLRSAATTHPYLRVSGLAIFEDFERFQSFSAEFKQIAEFINRCARHSIEESEPMQALTSQLEDLQEEVKHIKDRNERAVAERRLGGLREQMNGMLDSVTTIDDLPDWLMEGIDHFIQTFLKERINVRILPELDCPDFEVLGNLKRSCFVDSSLDNIVFAYGTKPRVPLSMMGLITAAPGPDAHPVDEARRIQKALAADSEEGGFEEGFRGIFDSMHGFEGFMRFSRYPRVTLYPIAIYRLLTPKSSGVQLD